jgi:hypothetical protein
MFLLSCALSVHAKRTIAVLKIKRGPGANTKNAEFFSEKIERALTAGGLFDVKTTAPLHALVEKLGGCKKAKCYYSAAREVGLNLLVTGVVRKRRADYIAMLEIIDTEFGEPVLEIYDKLPGDIMRVSDKWVAGFLSQLEYLTMAAEEMEVQETEETEEAAKATLIMQDEVSGRFTLEKSPYLIVRNIIVPAGKILEIDSGVKILISGDHASIVVFGQIVANGTKGRPVLFKSARKDAKAGDWDRLYVRGATRSYFTHCAFSNSRFGVHVDQGSATLTHCSFAQNAMGCVFAERSDVRLHGCDFGQGHILGINAGPGAVVHVDSGLIRKNTRAVVCHPAATVFMTGTCVENNEIGVVAHPRARVDLRDIAVRGNRVGVLVQKEVPRDKRFMIRGNIQDLKVANQAELTRHLTAPEKITAVKVRAGALPDTAGFEAGFASLPLQREPFLARMGLVGRVSLGLSFRHIDDQNEEVHKGDTALPHQTLHVPGLRPEFRIFMQSRMGERESRFTLDGFGNYFSERLADRSGSDHLGSLEAYRNIQRFEVMNLTTAVPGHEFMLGDFWQDQSELSVSLRQVRGLRYRGTYKMDRHRRIETAVMGGQSEIPYAVGLKPDMLDSNTTPERQEWLGMGNLSVQFTRGFKMGGHFIATRHVDDPVLFPGLTMDSTDLYGADPKLMSVSGGVDAELVFNKHFTGFAEFSMGYADTLSVNVDSGGAVPEGYSRDATIHHKFDGDNVAGLGGLRYSLNGFSGVLQYLHARNKFFTGGNPSIKPLAGSFQKVQYTGFKRFKADLFGGLTKRLDLSTGFDWERVGAEITGVSPDIYGKDRIAVDASVPDHPDSIENWLENRDLLDSAHTGFVYQPHEDRLLGRVGFVLPVAGFSIEPAFSCYYETMSMLKLDTKSDTMDVEVDGRTRKIAASEYRDNEGRFQYGAAVVYTPAFRNKTISGMRFKVDYKGILVTDFDDSLDGSPDSSRWDRNDGIQQRVRADIAFRLFERRLSNKFSAGFRFKTKDFRDEEKATITLLERVKFKIIPRRLALKVTAYWVETATEYNIEVTDASGLPTGVKKAVSETFEIYGGEGEFEYSFTPRLSVSAKGGYEHGLDDAETGGENFDTYFGGMVLNFLF